MSLDALHTTQKAVTINADNRFYGTFAEIGAGQEVARHFFVAGRASHTIAKTISAYDMTFSDEIYGKAKRYVSQPRLQTMLEHEFDLLNSRLAKKRGDSTCFFSFANTVATGSKAAGTTSHGWMGVRFQTQPLGATNNVYVHVQLLDRYRLQQQEALGILGVNLLEAAFYHLDDIGQFLGALKEDLSGHQVEIGLVEFSGPDTRHIDNRIVSLEMIRLGLTRAAVFDSNGQVILGSEAFFKKPVLIQRGTFRPITQVNVQILDHAVKQWRSSGTEGEPVGLLEVTTNNLGLEGEIDHRDFIGRVDTMAASGQYVMVSDFMYFYELKAYLRRCTDSELILVVGASHLDKLFAEKYYENLQGGILKAFGTLFDEQTQIYVYPYKSESACVTASTFQPAEHLIPLYRYLLLNKSIVDIVGCDVVDTSIHSADVRRMLAAGDSQWESFVPPAVKDLIRKQKLFGFKG